MLASAAELVILASFFSLVTFCFFFAFSQFFFILGAPLFPLALLSRRSNGLRCSGALLLSK